MKSAKNLLEQLKSQPHFNKADICQLSRQYGLENATVDVYISRYLQRQEIIQLKKGLYVTTDFFDGNKGDISYSFYLANIIRKPSYVSSWAALQYYNLATEAIYAITSVTPKVTRNYKTKAGNFNYQSIKPELFSGYSLAAGKYDFFIASPAKALFDLLYFKTHQFRGISSAEINTAVGELRIDFAEMNKSDQEKFNFLIKTHYERTDSSRPKKKNF